MEKQEEEKVCQSVPSGNTGKTLGTLAKKTRNAVFVWFFTWSEEDCPRCQVCQLWELLNEWCTKFWFQLEQGEDGYIHWQGIISLKTKMRMNGVKNILSNKIHLEHPINFFKAIAYCQKTDTRLLGPFNKEQKPIKTISILRNWQADLLKKVEGEPDDRKIIWIFDKEGGNGKSQLIKYCMKNKTNYYGLNSAKTSDIAFAMKGKNPHCILFNITRTKMDYFNYEAVESLKDGLIFSPKYESGMLIFNSPHIIIMSNDGPDISTMTLDRWEIYKIKNNKLIDITKKYVEKFGKEEKEEYNFYL